MTPFENLESDEAWRITIDQDSLLGPAHEPPDDPPIGSHAVWQHELTVAVDVTQREDGCITQIELRLTRSSSSACAKSRNDLDKVIAP